MEDVAQTMDISKEMAQLEKLKQEVAAKADTVRTYDQIVADIPAQSQEQPQEQVTQPQEQVTQPQEQVVPGVTNAQLFNVPDNRGQPVNLNYSKDTQFYIDNAIKKDPTLASANTDIKTHAKEKAGVIKPKVTKTKAPQVEMPKSNQIWDSLAISKLTPQEFNKLSPFEQQYLKEFSKKQVVYMSNNDIAVDNYRRTVNNAAEAWANKVAIDPSMDKIMQAYNSIYKDGVKSVNADIYQKALAKRFGDNATIGEKFIYGNKLNRALYSTGLFGDAFTWAYDKLGGTNTSGVLSAATFLNTFLEDTDTKNKRQAKQAQFNDFLKEFNQHLLETNPGTALITEIGTDPSTYITIPIVKAATKMQTFIKNFGIGAGFSGFMEYLKDDDKELWQYATSMGATGTLNGLFGHLATRRPNLYGPPEPPGGVHNTSHSIQRELDDIATDSGIIRTADQNIPTGTGVHPGTETPPGAGGAVTNAADNIVTPPGVGAVDNVVPTFTNPLTQPDILNIGSGVGSHTVDDIVDAASGGVVNQKAADIVGIVTDLNRNIGSSLNTDNIFSMVSRLTTQTSSRLKQEMFSIINNPNITDKVSSLSMTFLSHAADDIVHALQAHPEVGMQVYNKLQRGFASDEVSLTTVSKLLDEVRKTTIDLEKVNNLLNSIPQPRRSISISASGSLDALSRENRASATPLFNTLGLHLLRANGEAPLHTLVTNVSNIPNGIGVKPSLMGGARLTYNNLVYSLLDNEVERLSAKEQFINLAQKVKELAPQTFNTAEEYLDAIGAAVVGSPRHTAAGRGVVDAVTPAPAPAVSVIDKIKENIHDAISNIISSSTYTSDPETRKLIDALGNVFTAFKESLYHRYPTLTARETRSVTSYVTFANKILEKVNSGKPEHKQIRLIGRTTASGSTRMSIVNKQTGAPIGSFYFTVNNTNRTITNINTVNVGANTDGSLVYHTIHEFAVFKGYSVTSGGLFTSNQAARPLHMLSTVLRHPSSFNSFNIDSAPFRNAINNFFRNATNKTQEGFVGNALLDLMHYSKENFFALRGRTTGDIRHISADDSFLNRFSYDIDSNKFIIDGVKMSREEAAAAYNQIASDYLTSIGRAEDFTHKNFNTQVQMSILARKVMQDLAEAPDGNYADIINKYKTVIQHDKQAFALSDSGDTPFYQFTYNVGSNFILPALGIALASPAWSSEGELNKDEPNYALIAGGIIGTILAGKYAKAWLKKDPEFLANAAHYKGATKEVLDNTLELISKIETKLQDSTLSASAKENLRSNLNKTKKIRELILQHNTFGSLMNTIKSQGVTDYIKSKAIPVVRIADEKIEAIQTAYLNGDYQGIVDNIDFNLDRIDTSDEVVDLMNTVSAVVRDQIDLTRRGTVSLESIVNSASEMGFDVADLNKLYINTQELAEKFTAARILFLKVGKDATELVAKKAAGTATLEDSIEITRLLSLHTSIQAMLKSSQTEIARAVTSMRNTSRLARGSTNEELSRLLKQIGNQEGLTDAMERWLLASDAEKALIARKISDPSFYKKALNIQTEFWINGLLGGPATHIVNAVSNAIISLDTLITHMALSDNLADAGYHLAGFFRGVLEAPSAFGQAFMKGRSNLDRVSKYEIPDAISADFLNITNPNVARVVNTFGNIVRVPSRLLGATDEFFKVISYRMKLQSEAFKLAKQEGLVGQALVDRAKQMMDDTNYWVKVKNTPPGEVDKDVLDHLANFNHLYNDKLESLYDTAIETARVSTFTQEGGARMQAAQNFLYTNPEARFIVPFLRTPVNLLKYFGNRLPLVNAIGNPEYRAVLGKWVSNQALTDVDVRTLKELSFHTLIGSAYLWGFFNLAKEGKITGMSPTGKDMTQQQEGWRPYSARVEKADGTIEYIPMNRLDPLAMFLGVAADAYVVMNTSDRIDTKTDELITAALMSFVNNMVDKSYLQGLTTFSDAIGSGKEDKVNAWAKSFASSFVPNYIASIAREMDPVAREVHTITDAIKVKLPGYSQELAAKHDYRGREVPSRSSWNPFEPGIENTKDPLTVAMRDSGITFQKPPKAIPGTNIELDRAQYEYLTKKIGENYTNYASSVVNSSTWDSLTKNKNGLEGSRTVVLKDIMSKAKKKASMQLLQEYPDLMTSINEIKKAKIMNLSMGGIEEE